MIIGDLMVNLEGDRLTILSEGGALAVSLTICDPEEFLSAVQLLLDERNRTLAERSGAGTGSHPA
jgi:hypothetical protein